MPHGPPLKILILKPSSLGDVVQALPVLRLIKRQLPGSRIYWWIDTAISALLEDDPDLAGLVLFDRQRWRAPRHWDELWRSVRGLRAQRFDWVIDLQSLARSATMAWLANGGFTIGLEDGREGAPVFYDQSVRRPAPSTHAVDWYLQVLPALGIPVHRDFEWLPARPALAARLREVWRPEGARWIALQPGARWLNKRWPAEYFVELIRRLNMPATDWRFAILGGRDDAGLGAQISQADPRCCLDLTGKLSLPETVEWLRWSELLVTNDTGPMHLAAALGKPVVALFGPTDPRRTGPYGQIEHALQLPLPCAPCLKDVCRHQVPLECLRALSPAVVGERVRARLVSLPAPVPR